MAAPLARYRLSLWMVMASLMLTATMMHPTFSTLIVFFINVPLLLAIRYVAGVEAVQLRKDRLVLDLKRVEKS